MRQTQRSQGAIRLVESDRRSGAAARGGNQMVSAAWLPMDDGRHRNWNHGYEQGRCPGHRRGRTRRRKPSSHRTHRKQAGRSRSRGRAADQSGAGSATATSSGPFSVDPSRCRFPAEPSRCRSPAAPQPRPGATGRDIEAGRGPQARRRDSRRGQRTGLATPGAADRDAARDRAARRRAPGWRRALRPLCHAGSAHRAGGRHRRRARRDRVRDRIEDDGAGACAGPAANGCPPTKSRPKSRRCANPWRRRAPASKPSPTMSRH